LYAWHRGKRNTWTTFESWDHILRCLYLQDVNYDMNQAIEIWNTDFTLGVGFHLRKFQMPDFGTQNEASFFSLTVRFFIYSQTGWFVWIGKVWMIRSKLSYEIKIGTLALKEQITDIRHMHVSERTPCAADCIHMLWMY
jgi:hypothetical protein